MIKTKRNNNFFKQNVVKEEIIDKHCDSSDKYKRTYIDVSKEELKEFGTEDIDALKDFFYDIFLEFDDEK